MSSFGLALGGCSCSTYFVLPAAATPCQPAEGEQAVPQPHSGVSSQLQDFWFVLGKSWWVKVLIACKCILRGWLWESAVCSDVIFTDWTIHSQGSFLLLVKGQQSSPQPVSSELFRLGDRQGAAASCRPKPAPTESGHEWVCLAHPSLPGGCVLELHAPPALWPCALRVGGQPVPAQPGWPLRGAAVDRPHRLPPAQGRRHLLPGQEVFEVEVSIVGSECQHHWRVCGGSGQELQGPGAAGPDRLPASQEPVHQDSCRVLPEAAVPEGESLSQCDRVEPGSSTEAQCSDRCWAAFTEGSGSSSGCAGVCSLYQSPDIAKGPCICPTSAHRCLRQSSHSSASHVHVTYSKKCQDNLRDLLRHFLKVKNNVD